MNAIEHKLGCVGFFFFLTCMTSLLSVLIIFLFSLFSAKLPLVPSSSLKASGLFFLGWLGGRGHSEGGEIGNWFRTEGSRRRFSPSKSVTQGFFNANKEGLSLPWKLLNESEFIRHWGGCSVVVFLLSFYILPPFTIINSFVP